MEEVFIVILVFMFIVIVYMSEKTTEDDLFGVCQLAAVKCY